MRIALRTTKISILILLAVLMIVGALWAGVSIKIQNANWSVTIGVSDLQSGAGSDLTANI